MPFLSLTHACIQRFSALEFFNDEVFAWIEIGHILSYFVHFILRRLLLAVFVFPVHYHSLFPIFSMFGKGLRLPIEISFIYDFINILSCFY